MKVPSTNVQKLAVSSMLIATAVMGSFVSFPVLVSKCAPVQHVVNVMAGVMLGPSYAVAIAFIASLLRNVLGLGTVLAFPGSIFGALLAGVVYKYSQQVLAASVGEIIGTGIIGGLIAYPVAVYFLGVNGAAIGVTAFVIPFLISTTVGATIAYVLLTLYYGYGNQK